MKNKRLCAAILAMIMLAAMGITAFATEPQAVNATASTVIVNGAATAFEAYNINDNNFFKLRDLAYALSGSSKQFAVGWDGAANAISLTSGQPYEPVGGEMAQGDGTPKTAEPTTSRVFLDGRELNLTAYNIGGNNFFRLRDLMSALDIGVTWDGATSTIGIDASIGYVEDAPPSPPSTPAPPSQAPAATANGTTQGNLKMGGRMAASDGWIYYRVLGQPGLWKRLAEPRVVPSNGGQRTEYDQTQITDDDNPVSINVVGDLVYYVSEGSIYSVRTDGSNRTLIASGGGFMTVMGEWIYYSSGRNIMRCRTDGSSVSTLVLDDTAPPIGSGSMRLHIVGVTDEFVCFGAYAWSTDNPYAPWPDNALEQGFYVIGLDGSGLRRLTDTMPHHASLVDGDYLYYHTGASSVSGANGHVFKVSLSSGASTQLTREMVGMGYGSQINATGDWIYLVTLPDRVLHRLSKNGGEVEEMAANFGDSLPYVLGEWLHSPNLPNAGRMRADGSEYRSEHIYHR